MSARRIGYARVSSKDQNLDRQIDALKQYVTDPDRDIYHDEQSGKDFKRDGYTTVLNVLREGDVLFVVSLDRLGRNYTEIQEQWAYITQTIKADIVVLDMPLLDTRKHGDLDQRFIADLTLQILSYVAEKERLNIKERQRAGIEAAKARGKHLGRPKTEYPENWDDVMQQWQRHMINTTEAIKLTGLSRSTFYRMVDRYHNIPT